MTQSDDDDPEHLRGEATFRLRTIPPAPDHTERCAQALVGTLRRWCQQADAISVAKRMVSILEGSEP